MNGEQVNKYRFVKYCPTIYPHAQTQTMKNLNQDKC